MAVGRARVVRALTSSWFLGLVVAVLAWPVPSTAPDPGLDSSWGYVINQWFLGRVHGVAVVYPYGPWGFLVGAPAYHWGTSAIQLVFALAVEVLLASLVVRRVRRWGGAGPLPALLGVVVAAVAVVTSYTAGFFEPASVVCVLVAAEFWDGGLRRARAAGFLVAAASLLVVAKPSSGSVAVLALLGVVAAGTATLRVRLVRVAVALAAVGVAGVLWWCATQPLSDLPGWVAGSRQLAHGYDLQATEDPARAREYGYALVLAVALGLVLVARQRHRLPAAAVVGVTSYLTFRHGFTRHDAHSLSFFADVVALVVAGVDTGAGAAEQGEPSVRGRSRVLAPAATVVALVLDLVVGGPGSAVLGSPGTGIRVLGHQVHVAVSRSAFDAGAARDDAALRAASGLDPALRALVGDDPVDVEPYNQVQARAWHLNYVPLPLIQAETAFTADLDRLDADFVAGPASPPWVLVQDQPALDERWPLADSGGYQLQRFCHYRTVATSPGWRLLQRSADRCGAVQELGTVHLTAGRTVPVPVPVAGGVVYAVVRSDPGFLFAARAALFKTTTTPRLVLDSRRYRYSWTTDGQPTVLTTPEGLDGRPVTTSTLGFADYPGTQTVTFYAVAVTP